MSSLESIAQEWFDAFNAHNLDNLLALYHNDAKHYSPKLKIRKPGTNGLIVGNEALREWWADAFERLPTLQYTIISLTANDKRIFMEYLRKVEGERDLLVGEVLEIENGIIVASRVYHG